MSLKWFAKRVISVLALLCLTTPLLFLSSCSNDANTKDEYQPGTFLYELQQDGLEVVDSFIVSRGELYKPSFWKRIGDFFANRHTTYYSRGDLVVQMYMGTYFRDYWRNNVHKEMSDEEFEAYMSGIEISSLAYITLPKGTTTVKQNAFSNDPNIKYIEISSRYLAIEDGAFDFIPNMKRFFGEAFPFEKLSSGSNSAYTYIYSDENLVDQLNEQYGLDDVIDEKDIEAFPELAKALKAVQSRLKRTLFNKSPLGTITIVLGIIGLLGGVLLIKAGGEKSGFILILLFVLAIIAYFVLPNALY